MGPAYFAQRNPLKWIPQWIEEVGDIFTITSPLGRAVVVARPEWAKHVLADAYHHYQSKSRSYAVLRILFGNGLVTSEGEFWRGQRKLIQPAFHRHRLDRLFAMMVERAEGFVSLLQRASSAGQPWDVCPPLSQLTLDIISRAMFSTDVEGSAADVSRHIATLNEFALRMLRHPWMFLLPRSIPTPFNGRQVRALRDLNRIVYGIIQSRRQLPDEHDDLLSMLLSACEEGTGRGMTDEQLRDEVMTIFVAGHETTANAMSWLIYLLAQNPEQERRLIEEIDANWPEEGLTTENIGRFAFVRRAIEESLRMFPSIWSVGRRCTADDEIAGYGIPQGMNVVIPIAHFHWSARYWDEPQRFDPDRFLPERRPGPEQMIYFPFGAGPRSCIGNHFALQELMIFTVIFYRHFTFRLPPGFTAVPDPLITLRPKNGIQVIVKRRTAPTQNPTPEISSVV